LEIDFTIAGGAMAQEERIRQQELDQKRHYWKAHINSWQASRVSQTEYCRRHELKFHQFGKFVPKPKVPISLVQVPLAAVARAAGHLAPSTALRVAIAPDICIEVCPGFDPPTLKQVVTALRGIR
jgi:hypothetical protein